MTASSVNLPLDVVLPLVVAMVLALGLLCIADAVLTRRGLKTAQSVAADLRTGGLTDCRTGGLADWRTGGLADWRTGGLAGFTVDTRPAFEIAARFAARQKLGWPA